MAAEYEEQRTLIEEALRAAITCGVPASAALPPIIAEHFPALAANASKIEAHRGGSMPAAKQDADLGAQMAQLAHVLQRIAAAITTEALDAGQAPMEYVAPPPESVCEEAMQVDGRSVARLATLPVLLDAALYLAEAGYATDVLAVNLLEELLEVVTLAHCGGAIDWLERAAPAIKALPGSSHRLALLRACNSLLRRLSRSTDPELCARVLLLLAAIYDLNERSGVNLSCAVNTSHPLVLAPKLPSAGAQAVPAAPDTSRHGAVDGKPDASKSEGGSADGMGGGKEPIPESQGSGPAVAAEMGGDNAGAAAKAEEEEEELYQTFWGLQDRLQNLRGVANQLKEWNQLRADLSTVLAALGKRPIAAAHNRSCAEPGTGQGTPAASTNALSTGTESLSAATDAVNSTEDAADIVLHFGEGGGTPQYLASRKLFALQLRDATFRRAFLVQVLIALQALMQPIKAALSAVQEPPKKAQAEQIAALQAEAWAALRATPEDGARFATAVGRSLSREAHFVDWKGRPRVDPKAPRDPKAPDQPKVWVCANYQLDPLTGADTVEARLSAWRKRTAARDARALEEARRREAAKRRRFMPEEEDEDDYDVSLPAQPRGLPLDAWLNAHTTALHSANAASAPQPLANADGAALPVGVGAADAWEGLEVALQPKWPTLERMGGVALRQLDPEADIDPEYSKVSRPAFCWKLARLIARRDFSAGLTPGEVEDAAAKLLPDRVTPAVRDILDRRRKEKEAAAAAASKPTAGAQRSGTGGGGSGAAGSTAAAPSEGAGANGAGGPAGDTAAQAGAGEGVKSAMQGGADTPGVLKADGGDPGSGPAEDGAASTAGQGAAAAPTASVAASTGGLRQHGPEGDGQGGDPEWDAAPGAPVSGAAATLSTPHASEDGVAASGEGAGQGPERQAAEIEGVSGDGGPAEADGGPAEAAEQQQNPQQQDQGGQ